MIAVRSRSSSKSLAFGIALVVLLTLAIPFAGIAFAHTDNEHDLQVTPEVDQNPTGTTHTLTATLTNGAAPADGEEIDFEIESGPAARVNCTRDATTACSGGTTNNDANSPGSPDMSCTIPSGANSCQVFFTSDTQGTHIVRSWVDDDKNNATLDFDAAEGRDAGGTDCDNVGGITFGAGAGPAPGTAQEGGRTDCATPTDVPGDRTEVDDTDVVEKLWGQAVAAACIDAEPENDTNPSGSEHTITARATSSGAAPTDVDGTFDCAGTALPAGSRINVTITDDNPNAFIRSVNGVATGGPSAGGPDTATATTDANGQITVVIQCVSGTPANCTGDNDVLFAVEGAQSGAQTSDSVNKVWQQAGTQAAFDATPENDVNEINQTHVITCRVTDAFGTGVSGVNCDAQVTAGPNADNNIGNDLNTTNGYIGQCTTAASGTCTISYTSTETGTDTISVFTDANANDLQGAGADETGEGTVSDVITKEWVAVGQASQDVDIDMENSPQGTATCDGLADGTDDANDEKTATNNTNTTHEVCAERFGPLAERDSGPITFTITGGPGSLFVDLDDDELQDANEASVTTATVQEGCSAGAGFNCVHVTSTTAGTTTIQACVEGSTTICDTGTKTWQGGASRTIVCTPETATNQTGTTHTVTCTVRDRFGNPVSGQTVRFTRTGVGEYASLACFSATQTTCNIITDAAGQASVRINTAEGEEGTTTVSGEIIEDLGDADNQFDTDEACDQAAGNLAVSEGDNSNTDTDNQTQNAPAGACEDTTTKTWDDDVTECSDGIDNDGDGDVDLADEDCDNAADNSESGDEPLPPRPCRDRGADVNVIVGTSGPDVLNGTGGRDVICGAGGDDVISGRGGNDLIVGNGGDDTIGGGGGKDNASGNGGDDTVSGNKGNDAVKGNAGNDSLKGNAGIDAITGGGGNDTLQGGDGQDILKGGDGRDTLRGGDGDDALDGGPGRDQCFGNAGDDSIRRCE